MAFPHPMLLPPVFFPLIRNQPSQPSPSLLLPRKPPLPHLYHKSHSQLQASSKDESGLSTLITDLEKQGDHIDKIAEEDLLPRNRQPEHPLSDRWREIHGHGDWAGLLDPMDPLLRTELIRYGEMAQACYDAFDYDPSHATAEAASTTTATSSSPRDARCWLRDHPLPLRHFQLQNPKLLRHFSLVPPSRKWSERANWIGYVAVSTDEASASLSRRDIVVAWRGTVTRLEWIADLMD